MKIKRIAKSICAMITAVAVVAYYSEGGTYAQASTSVIGSAVGIDTEDITKSVSTENVAMSEMTEMYFEGKSEGEVISDTSSII